mgnify:FL=1
MTDHIGKFTLGATGDILIHKRVYEKAKKPDGNGYDFNSMLAEVKPIFKKEHLIIVNQESIIAGEEIGLSDFPRFNSPVEIGYTLKDLNVDIVNLANNHIMDHGEEGVLKSIENWEKIGLPYVGAYKSKEDQETLRIFHKNGLKICFLSYSKSLGTGKRPKGKEYLANKYDDMGVKWVRRLIDRIKKNNLADIVVLSIHFGKEYQMLPTAYQRETSSNLSDAGVDIIIGHHRHVLQPPAYLTNSKGHETFVAYSLGNFFSGQKGIYRQIGAYMTVDVEKDLSKQNGFVHFSNPKMKLTFVDTNDYKIYLLEDIVKDRDYIETEHGTFESGKVYQRMKEHLTKYIPDLDVS